jgi:hypothetical protein
MGTASGSEGVLTAFHEAFGILKTAIRTGGTPEPLPVLPRFLRQEAAILNDSLPLCDP